MDWKRQVVVVVFGAAVSCPFAEPQGLTPQDFLTASGTAKAVPFPNGDGPNHYGAPEGAPFRVFPPASTFGNPEPQGLTPQGVLIAGGTAKAVPFPNGRSGTTEVGPFPSTAHPSGATAGAPAPKAAYKSASTYSGNFEAVVLRATKVARLDGLRWPEFTEQRSHVRDFYRALGYKPAWIEDSKPTSQARKMLDELQHAESEGLNPEDYDGPRWEGRVARLASEHAREDEFAFDLALTVSAMRYLSDVHSGKLDPGHKPFEITVDNRKLDLASYLRLISAAENPAMLVSAVEPQTNRYRETRFALLKYVNMAKQGDGEKLPAPVGIVYRGGYYDHMPELARRLRQLGDFPSKAFVSADTTVYGGVLMDAVQRFQQRHALPPTGNLTAETIEQLNVPLRARVEQLRLSLERERWPQPKLNQRYLVVNLPEYRLTAYDQSGREALSMSVTVGDTYDFQTPVFQGSVRYVVFRPYWYMTSSILRNEVLPDLQDEDFLKENNLEVITRGGTVVKSATVDARLLRQLRTGSLKLRQKPGAGNALGLMKVVLPNPYDIYLHDTPQSRTLFSEDGSRAESHGCIHLERPAELAQWLLQDKPEWTLQQVTSAMESGRDDFNVYLSHSVPILVTYETARVSADGEVHFYADIYGRDAQLETAMAGEGRVKTTVPVMYAAE